MSRNCAPPVGSFKKKRTPNMRYNGVIKDDSFEVTENPLYFNKLAGDTEIIGTITESNNKTMVAIIADASVTFNRMLVLLLALIFIIGLIFWNAYHDDAGILSASSGLQFALFFLIIYLVQLRRSIDQIPSNFEREIIYLRYKEETEGKSK